MDATKLHQRQAWQAFAPQLHVCDADYLNTVAPFPVAPQQSGNLAQRLLVEGYIQANSEGWGLDFKLMADTVRAMTDANISPVFAFMYDEYWVPFHKLHALYSSLLGGKYYLLPDFWVWNVDPKRGESGWKPHRDKGRDALFENGAPKSLTTWIPLSRATPLNGCMYIVPANFDPTYNTADEGKWQFEYASIRALPGKPGDFFIWNQAVLHWGSRTAPHGGESRVSMAFEFQRADVAPYNQPLLEPMHTLQFDHRLKLIAKQILQYRHMYKLAPDIERVALELLGQASQPAPAPTI
ncbi:MAG: phytanoyl-CoA dioxygenase family protein [Pseudolabrys sp.]